MVKGELSSDLGACLYKKANSVTLVEALTDVLRQN